jgi:hypothetical protein
LTSERALEPAPPTGGQDLPCRLRLEPIGSRRGEVLLERGGAKRLAGVDSEDAALTLRAALVNGPVVVVADQAIEGEGADVRDRA